MSSPSPLDTLLYFQFPKQSAKDLDAWFSSQMPFQEYEEYGQLFQNKTVNPYGIHAFLEVLYAHRGANDRKVADAFKLLAGRSLLTIGWLPQEATSHDVHREATLSWLHSACIPYYQGAQQGNHHLRWWSQLMQWCQEHPWLQDGLASRDLRVYSDRTSFGKLLTTQKEPGPLLLLRWADAEVALQDTTTNASLWYHHRHVSTLLASAYPDAAQRMRCALTLMEPSASQLASAVLRAPEKPVWVALPQLENITPSLA